MEDTEKARAEYRARLAEIVTAAGLDPDSEPPASVRDVVTSLGPVTLNVMDAVGYEPTALRWLHVGYQYWSERLAEAATLSEDQATAVVAEARRILRVDVGTQYAQDEGFDPQPGAP